MICVRDSDRRPFDSGRQIGVAKRRFPDSGFRISVSELRKIDSCCHGVTHAGESICTSSTLTQRILGELGAVISLTAILERLPSIASNLHQGHIARSHLDLSRPHIKSN